MSVTWQGSPGTPTKGSSVHTEVLPNTLHSGCHRSELCLPLRDLIFSQPLCPPKFGHSPAPTSLGQAPLLSHTFAVSTCPLDFPPSFFLPDFREARQSQEERDFSTSVGTHPVSPTCSLDATMPWNPQPLRTRPVPGHVLPRSCSYPSPSTLAAGVWPGGTGTADEPQHVPAHPARQPHLNTLLGPQHSGP